MWVWNGVYLEDKYRITGYFRGPIFSQMANTSKFREKVFANVYHTHMSTTLITEFLEKYFHKR